MTGDVVVRRADECSDQYNFININVDNITLIYNNNNAHIMMFDHTCSKEDNDGGKGMCWREVGVIAGSHLSSSAGMDGHVNR